MTAKWPEHLPFGPVVPLLEWIPEAQRGKCKVMYENSPCFDMVADWDVKLQK